MVCYSGRGRSNTIFKLKKHQNETELIRGMYIFMQLHD